VTAVSRYWQSFRRWRRARPFWGGLFLILAGLELFLSGNLDLGNIQVHMGPQGFLSYLLPVIELVCGLLVWFTPQQRLFYAIVAAITSVYSLIGLNLGGFFVGMLFGMVGSALAFGWQARRRPVADVPVADADETQQFAAVDADGYQQQGYEQGYQQGYAGDEPAPGGYDPAYGDGGYEQPGYHDDSGYPAAPRHSADAAVGDLFDPPEPEPSHHTRPRRPADGDPDGQDQLNHGQLPKRSTRGTYVILLLVLTLSAGTVATFHAATPAAAAPSCPTGKPAPSTGPVPGSTPTPTASPQPSAASTDDNGGGLGGIIGGIVDGIGSLLGGDSKPADPPAVAPTPTPTPTPTAEPTGRAGLPLPKVPGLPGLPGLPGETCDPSTGPGGPTKGPNKVIAAAADQPLVQGQPSKLTGSKVVMNNLSYDGLVDLPTHDGTIRVMQFSMDKSVTNDFKLLTKGPGGKITQLTSSALTVDGNVKFYCTQFGGNLVGVAPIVFTVQSPPPAIIVPVIDFLPVMVFTKPDIDLVFVDTNVLKAPNLLVKPV
jgi:hypothetical protein